MLIRENFLSSERLCFGFWRESDIDLAWELFGDSDITKYVGGPFSRAQVLERIRSEMSSRECIGVQYWPLFRRDDGEFVGCCGLKSCPEPGCYEMGFYIKPSMQGKGYAWEAACRVIEYAFSKIGAKALFAGHSPHNEASRLLLGKLGFVYTSDVFYPPTGLMHPLYRLDQKLQKK